MNENKIIDSLQSVINPLTSKSLTEDGSLEEVKYDSKTDVCYLVISVVNLSDPLLHDLKKTIAKVVKINLKISGIKIKFVSKPVLTFSPAKFIFFLGAKGGVGTSSLIVKLGKYLQKENKRIGLIDLDFQTPALVHYLGGNNEDVSFFEDKIIPNLIEGFEIMSTAFFEDPKTAVIWQYQMTMTMIENIFYRVSFSQDLDYILIDLGSNQGEKLKKCLEIIKNGHFIIVTENSEIGELCLEKRRKALELLEGKLLGVVTRETPVENIVKLIK